MNITKENILHICQDIILPQWAAEPIDFPEFICEKRVSEEQRRENEALLDKYLPSLQKNFVQSTPKQINKVMQEGKMRGPLKELIAKEKILNLKASVEEEHIEQMLEGVKEFVRKTAEFDEQLGLPQLWQALRNYFIYLMIAQMQGKDQNAADPIWAYSMLYPYTDNYIDDQTRGEGEKHHYNHTIADKLQEKTITPQNELEEKTAQLLDCIILNYHGTHKKDILENLLLLLEAQGIGMQKQAAAESLDINEILKISCYKGGTSVVADYLFSVEQCDSRELEFYLKFGLVLQLIDDLQDVCDDTANHSQTVMTQALQNEQLESAVNRLLWFTQDVIIHYQPVNPKVHPMVLEQCIGIILLTVVANEQLFSSTYAAQMKEAIPFSAEYWQKIYQSAASKIK